MEVREVVRLSVAVFAVSLSAQTTPTFTGVPVSFSFTYQLQALGTFPELPDPERRCFTPRTSNGASVAFTIAATATTPAGVDWVAVNPASGTTGATEVCVSPNARGLEIGRASCRERV